MQTSQPGSGYHFRAGNSSSETDLFQVPAVHLQRVTRIESTSPDGTSADVIGNEAAQHSSSEPVRDAGSAVPVVTVAPIPSSLPGQVSFHALQEWEGHVVEIHGDELVAALVDLTANSSHEEEEAIIPLTEIADDDAAALRVGAIFRWVIGYERSPSGTKKRVSQIVFRDLPRVTERDLQHGREWARETRRAFDL
ncbi:MAG: hypothetical protein OXP36_12360 [Gammaproteobacteria bacterium]|nr:hypothetical protein [Gammaproteobacteria bacterium]